MSKSPTLNVTQNIKTPSKQITPADTTTALQLVIGASAYTVTADQAILRMLQITSTDSAPKNVQVILNDGTNDRILGTVPVPALAGTDGTVPAVDALSSTWLPGLPIDQNGKRYVPLGGSYVIKVAAVATLTAAKTINVLAGIEEF